LSCAEFRANASRSPRKYNYQRSDGSCARTISPRIFIEKDCKYPRCAQYFVMFNRAMILAGLVGVAGVFPVAAFGQAIDGIVRGPDGKALKDAEVRVEGKDKKIVATTKTDARGHYSYAKLSPGVYKVSVVLGGAVNSSVNVKTTTNKSRIDFDLKPTAAKKVKHYVWVEPTTGSHIGGGWVEVDDAGTTTPGGLNTQTASGELARQMSRNDPNHTHP